MARKPKLNKPFRTPDGPKKFSVYVKDEDKVKKVNFGDPDMDIKRDDPERRKAYRARHNCDNPGPKTKANYWSCLMWSKKPVSKIVSSESEVKTTEPAWAVDEEIWARAKKAASKQNPDDLYALTTDIYKKMGGRIKGKKEADKTGVKTTHWFWGVEAFYPVKAAKPEVVEEPKDMSSADEEAQKLLVDNPNMPAATLLNALKSKGVKLVDEKDALEADGVTTNAAVTRESSPVKFQTTAHLQESTVKNAGVGPIRFRVALIQEGLGNLRDGFFYSKEAIESGIAAFEGRKCFADHPSRSEEDDRPERSVRDIIGHFENVATQENEDGSLSLVGDLVMPPDPPFEWARSLVRSAVAYNKKYPEQNLVGLSINASGDAAEIPFDEFVKSYELPEGCKPKLLKAREGGMERVRVVSSIRDAVSCDLVTEPGAKGKVLDIVESEKIGENMAKKKISFNEAEEKKVMAAEDEAKKLPMAAEEEKEEEKKEADEDHADEEQDKKLILDMIKKHMGDDADLEDEAGEAAMEAYQAYKAMGESEDEALKCAGKAMKLAKHMAAKKAEAEKKESEDEAKHEAEDECGEDEAKKESEVVKLEGRIAFLERELKKRELAEMLDSKLKESGLGRAETDKIRKLIGEPKSEAEINKTIKIFKEAFTSRSESSKGSSFFVSTEKQTVTAPKKGKVSFGECV